MKILYYSSHPNLGLLNPTGYGAHMRGFIHAARRAGHDVQTLIAGGEETATAVMAPPVQPGWKKFARHLIPSMLWRSMKEARLLRFDDFMQEQLREKIAQQLPDLVYERASWLQHSGVCVAREMKVPLCLELNAPFPEEVKSFEKTSSLLEGRGRRRMQEQFSYAHRIVVVSSALKNYLVRDFDVSASKVLVVPNAVEENVFVPPSQAQIAEFRRRYGLQQQMIIGFVGSIFPYHGVDILIEAFAKFAGSAAAPDAALVIIGDGYLLPELKRRVAELKLEKQIIFTGPLRSEEVKVALYAINIGVMAKSNWYGSPVKIFEYGAAGNFVVAPDTVPVRDVMEDRKDGWLLRPEEEQLLEAFYFYHRHRDEAKKMAERFREKIRQNYTWDKATRNIIEACI